MKIAICEDELIQQERLESLIREFDKNFEFKVSKFGSGEELITFYEKGGQFDIIFMDIRMKKLSGIETGKIIRRSDKVVKIILTTSIIEYAIKGYSIKVYDFILKPITKKNFNPVFGRVLQELEKANINIYCINNRDEQIYIPIEEIIYLESNGRKVEVHTKDNMYDYYAKLSEMDFNFVRTHKSF